MAREQAGTALAGMKPRLRVSVFNAEEVRAAIGGGADDIDCEDPRTDYGMFEPRVITDIAYAVRKTPGGRDATTSANIGYERQVYERGAAGVTAGRSPIETRNKAAQEALGLAAAMDVGDGRPAVIKFGVDGVQKEEVSKLVASVKTAIRHSRQYQNHKLVGSILVIDCQVWDQRKRDRRVILPLLEIGQFYYVDNGSIDLKDYQDSSAVSQYVQARPKQSRVELIEPYLPSELGMPEPLEERIKTYTKLLAEGGVDGVLIDTPLQAKVARICLVDAPENAADDGGGSSLARHGVCNIELLNRFSEYCRYLNVEAWLAGSIQPYHAPRLAGIPTLDVVMCRGSVSAVVKNPYGEAGGDDRASRRISAERVRAMANALNCPQEPRT